MFFINGFLTGSWAPQIPVFLTRLDISKFTLGVLILGFGLGALTFMPLSGYLMSRYGSRAVTRGFASVAVFGPSDEVLRRPWTGVAVRGPRSLQEFKDLDPRLNQHIQHMMDLPADRVLKKSRKLLADLHG